jgi:hypothetical protein
MYKYCVLQVSYLQFKSRGLQANENEAEASCGRMSAEGK